MQAVETERIKMGDRDWSIQCAHCGKYFEAKRSDASFCSPRCRVGFSREPQKLLNHVAMLNFWSRQVYHIALRYKRSDKVYQAMLGLQKSVNFALTVFETEK